MFGLENIQRIASITQSLTVVAAALFAVFKFKLYRLWTATHRSEMLCTTRVIGPKDLVFEAEYKIFNTGERPLRIQRVTLKLCQAKQVNGVHLDPDPDHLLAAPTVIAENKKQAGPNDHFKPIRALGYVNKGADASFTLRCRLTELPDVMFILGEFIWQGGTRTYSEMWVNEKKVSP